MCCRCEGWKERRTTLTEPACWVSLEPEKGAHIPPPPVWWCVLPLSYQPTSPILHYILSPFHPSKWPLPWSALGKAARSGVSGLWWVQAEAGVGTHSLTCSSLQPVTYSNMYLPTDYHIQYWDLVKLPYSPVKKYVLYNTLGLFIGEYITVL